MSKTANSAAKHPYELPVRKDHGTLEEAGREAARHGRDIGAIARACSANEWVCDSSRAEDMQEALGLDDTQFLTLLTGLVERNRSIWGPYCEASLSPWYADLIDSVEGLSETALHEAQRT